MTVTTKKEYVYKIHDKKTGRYFAGYSYFSSYGKEFKSDITARNSLNYFVSTQLSHQLWKNKGKLGKPDIEKLFPYDLEIVKVEIIKVVESATSLGTLMENKIISHTLSERNVNFGDFWDNAIRKDYADKIEYVIQLNAERGVDRKNKIIEARTFLRNLGVKTRTFREYEGMFGFYNKDQALKARLTLDAKDFIDITELRKELFE